MNSHRRPLVARVVADRAAATTRMGAVERLSAAREALQARAVTLSPIAGGYLWTAVDYISDELDQLVARNLVDGDAYRPATDAFTSQTAQGSRFAGMLDDIKQSCSAADPVFRAAEAVLALIPGSRQALELQAVQSSFWCDG